MDPEKIEHLITRPGVMIQPPPDPPIRNIVKVMTGRRKDVTLKLEEGFVFHSIVLAPVSAGSSI